MVGDCTRNAGFQKQLIAILNGQFLSQLTVAEVISGKKQRWRKDATMLQPANGSITCSACNASYESDTKLREHQRMAHRGGGNEESPQVAADVVQSEDPQD